MNEVSERVKDFVLGGDASFTIYQEGFNGKRPVAIKYRVKSNDNRTCWFVYTEMVKDGSLVTSGRNMVYQGYLKKDLSFNIGNKGMEDYNRLAIKGLLWVLHHVGEMPDMVHVYHHGRCSVCGRKLTDPESLRTGLGPTCRKKVNFL